MEIQLNAVLLPRLISIHKRISECPASEAKSIYCNEVQRLTVSPSPDKPPTGHAKQPTYDEMLLDLLKRVMEEAKTAMDDNKEDVKDSDKWQKRLGERLDFHEEELRNRSKECDRLATQEEEEQAKKITSDDVTEGYSSGVSEAGVG